MQVRICVFGARSSLDLHSMPMLTVILLDSELKGYVTYILCHIIRQISLGAAVKTMFPAVSLRLILPENHSNNYCKDL